MKLVLRKSQMLALTTALALAPVLTGCGGGSGGSGAAVTGKAPSAVTRAAVRKMQTRFLRAFANGAPTVGAFSANTLSLGSVGAGNSAGATAGVGSAPGGNASGIGGISLVGGYLNSLRPSGGANNSTSGINRSAKRRASRRSRDASDGSSGSTSGGSGSGGSDPVSVSNFYYDDWLALWVDTTVNTSTTYSQKFYEDEAKTIPAGSLDSTSSDWSVYPVSGSYHFLCTAGSLKGTSSDSTFTYNADYSGASHYSSATSDGWKYKGDSINNADGSSSWTNRTDSPDGSYSTDTGTFRIDGSSVTKTTGSDGYTVEYVNNADGSATGKITGPFDGLPANIVRDTTGKTTITYADGTVDIIPGWDALYNGDGTVTSDGGASTGTGSVGSGSTTGNAGPLSTP